MWTLATETWTWYGFTWLVVIARMASRVMLQGSFKRLQSDDALMIFAMACDTVLIVGINIISHTNSNLLDPNKDTQLTPDDIREREFGSKMVLVVEQMQCIVIWTVKACFLIMYNRLTMTLKLNLTVKIVTAYVAVGFVAMEILYFGVWCRPFNQYWAVPPDNVQCSAATNHLITNAALNISSDLMIILIPMPVFMQSQLPRKRKYILCGLFALGSFTILSAILNKYYSFTQPFGAEWTFWYIRESSTAIIVANLPLTWTILRRIFGLRSFNGKSSNQHTTDPNSRFRSLYSRNQVSVVRGDDPALEPSTSEEQINKGYGIPLKIYQRHEVEITSEAAVPENRRPSSQGSSEGHGITVTVKSAFQRGARDEETASEKSTAGIVKVSQGI